MVVKILSTSASFNGVGYNERKVSEGSAELVSVKNFGIYEGLSGVSVQDYKEYLIQYSTGPDENSSRVKNPQFHAIISCEGREYDSKQLAEIAEQYLEKLGYKNNPALIYFHSDTANNHVHIVSTRIDENGLKINDSFERRRSQAAIKEILNQDIGVEVKAHVDKAKSYNFSSEAQFKMLLEAQGVTVKAKDDLYHYIKYNTVGYESLKSEVSAKFKEYQEPEKRVKQLQQIFEKYKPALDTEQFAELMRSKFGVELVYHKGKGKDKPYGYTIIDHSKKQVLKGSQVMKLSELLSVKPRVDVLKAGGELIATLAEDEKLCYREFKKQLSKLGFELNSKGEIMIKGEENVSFSISKERMKQVLYNDRFAEARKFSFSNSKESDIIAKVFSVNKQDLSQFVPEQGQVQRGSGKSAAPGFEQYEEPPARLRKGVYAGILLEHGAANFEFDENSGTSYYAKLQTEEGVVTLWGKDIERAIEEWDTRIGDEVGMEYLGKQPETVTSRVKDEAGNWVEKETQVMKGVWAVDLLDDEHYESKESKEQEQRIVSDKLNSLLEAGKDLGDIAKENNYSFAKNEGETYLVDKNGSAIYNMADLTDKELNYSTARVYDLDREYSPYVSQELEQSSGGFGQMLDIVEYMLQVNSRGTEADNKRKRKINQ